MIEAIEIAAVLAGVFFLLVSSLGVLRLKGFYMRMHAPTKASTLGLICLVIAVAMNVPDPTVATKAVLMVLFLGATAPVGAHLLTRAAYRSGIASHLEPVVDEYAPVVHRRRARLANQDEAEDVEQERARGADPGGRAGAAGSD